MNLKINIANKRRQIEDYENSIESNDVNGERFRAEYFRISRKFEQKKQEALDLLVKHSSHEIAQMKTSLLNVKQDLIDSEAFASKLETKLKLKKDFLNVDEDLKTGEAHRNRTIFQTVNRFDDFTFELTGGMKLQVKINKYLTN